jgi:tryptophan-rich sensory protein
MATNSFNIPTEPASLKYTPDFNAAASYVLATGIQWSLLAVFLTCFQRLIDTLPLVIPRVPILSALFFFLSVRSRVFSPLNNSRPAASKSDPVFRDRIRPSWQPAPRAFPIIWSTIALLRTVSSILVWKVTGSLSCAPILFFVAHLAIGDTWNTINNVEKRLGTAVLGVQFVYLSVLIATQQYYQISPKAAYVLAPSAIWLSIANFLVFSIWRLNSQVR